MNNKKVFKRSHHFPSGKYKEELPEDFSPKAWCPRPKITWYDKWISHVPTPCLPHIVYRVSYLIYNCHLRSAHYQNKHLLSYPSLIYKSRVIATLSSKLSWLLWCRIICRWIAHWAKCNITSRCIASGMLIWLNTWWPVAWHDA